VSEEWTFHGALIEALAAIEDVTKGRQAKVKMKDGGEYRYSYSNIDDVLDAVKPVLAAHGLAVMQDTRGNGQLIEVRTVIVGKDGTRMESEWLGLRGGTAQESGSAITYARRYSLQSFLGIATDDDDGKAASAPRQAPPRQQGQPERHSSAPPPPGPRAASRTHAEAAIVEMVAAMTPRQRAEMIPRFRREFGAVLNDLPPERHERAHEWMEAEVARWRLEDAGVGTSDEAPHPAG
jgi:hypothetical protein